MKKAFVFIVALMMALSVFFAYAQNSRPASTAFAGYAVIEGQPDYLGPPIEVVEADEESQNSNVRYLGPPVPSDEQCIYSKITVTVIDIEGESAAQMKVKLSVNGAESGYLGVGDEFRFAGGTGNVYENVLRIENFGTGPVGSSQDARYMGFSLGGNFYTLLEGETRDIVALAGGSAAECYGYVTSTGAVGYARPDDSSVYGVLPHYIPVGENAAYAEAGVSSIGEQPVASRCQGSIRTFEILFISMVNETAKFSINNEQTGYLSAGDNFTLKDGTVLSVVRIVEYPKTREGANGYSTIELDGNQVVEDYGLAGREISIDESAKQTVATCLQTTSSCLCTAEYNPVCGVNNNTYSNSCFAGCAGVEIAYRGACQNNNKCPPKPAWPFKEGCEYEPVYDRNGCIVSYKEKCEDGAISCDGCLKDGKCLPFGTRLISEDTAVFCDASEALLEQKEKGESCQNNYECKTNQCSSGKCVDLVGQLSQTQSMLEKVLAWFERIFGKKN